jgi:hypothetical protein
MRAAPRVCATDAPRRSRTGTQGALHATRCNALGLWPWTTLALALLVACQDPPTIPAGHVPGANARTAALTAEARRRGLDRGDLIIDRRLVQKLEWAVALEVEVPEPTDDELAAFHAKNAGRYKRPATTSFQQIFFDRARRTTADADAAQALKASLTGPPPSGDPWTRGHTRGATRKQIEGAFGNGFASALAEEKVDVWFGPISSPYGHHVIKITERRAEELPTLDAVRGRVREDWRTDRRRLEVTRELDEIATPQQ